MLSNEQKNKIKHKCVAEIRMFKWRSRVTNEDRTKNEYVRSSLSIVSKVDKISWQ